MAVEGSVQLCTALVNEFWKHAGAGKLRAARPSVMFTGVEMPLVVLEADPDMQA